MHGKVLKIVRIANDLSIKELAKLSNISASFISEIEKEKKGLNITTFKKICIGLNLKPYEFMTLNEYYESLIGEVEPLKVYQLVLLRTLKLYIEKENKPKEELQTTYTKKK